MIPIPPIDTKYLIKFLVELLNTPSPTGYTHKAINLTEKALKKFPMLELEHTRKGALLAKYKGARSDTPRGISAHVDTLGAMVKEIKTNGRLKLSKIGGFAWNTVEGESCTIFTRSGKAVRGSILFTKASAHIFHNDVNEIKRDNDTMEVRLDLRVNSVEETQAQGIEVGDYVAFDPRVEINNEFVRSRHLDDKACVACLLTAIKALHDANITPAQTALLLISNFEEVGHGASAGFPPEMAEMIAVDMAAVGEGQTSDEYHASICVKDTSGPYHHGLSQHLRNLADQHNIPHKVDIYPYYGSDASALLRAGGDVAVALIGPGVDASHNYERTHLDALIATTKWIVAYLMDETVVNG
ncbi:MAG: M42 family metallopeptidase [Anaerolineales bacterium]|nr:M42 family metallopeptidase [Anaerolineales bacterium]